MRSLLFLRYTILLILTVASITIAAPSNQYPSIVVRHIPAENNYISRRAACSASQPCSRSQYCSSGVCQNKVADNSTCSTTNSPMCISGSCDAVKATCQSSSLSHLTVCSSSSSCVSGNCQNGFCQAQSYNGARCQQDSNCFSGSCSITTRVCVQPANTNLLPVLPWDRDLTDLANLDPSPFQNFTYTDSGKLDVSAQNFMVQMSVSAYFPSVSLAHSSWIGQVQCVKDQIAIPFQTLIAYNYAKQKWSSQKQMVFITHTLGCTSTTNPEQRTFWMINSLTFDDAHMTVDASGLELGVEDAFNHINLIFGQYTPANATTKAVPKATATGSTPTSTTVTSTAAPTVSVIPGPGACNSACPTISNFDQALDDALGYYDFANNFVSALASYAPGIAPSDVGYDGTLQKRWSLSKFAKSVAKAVAKKVVQVAQKTMSKAIASAKVGIKYLVKAAKIVAKFLNEWNPHLGGRLGFKWKPLQLQDSPWDYQYKIFSYEKGGEDDQDKGKNAAKSAKLEAKKPPKAKLKVSGSMDVFCVDCLVAGSFDFSGALGFNLVPGQITHFTIDYGGNFEAALNIGVEGHLTVSAEKRKTIASFPLPGGFVIKEVVTLGPSLSVETRLAFKADMEADLLLGMDYKIPPFKTHLDLLNSALSTVERPTSVMTYRHELSGAALIRASFGIPISINMGLEIPKLKIKKDASFTVEPALIAMAMTGSDADDFTDQGLQECELGLAYKVGTGASVSLNLFDFTKVDLGKFNGPNAVNGCLQILDQSDLDPPPPSGPTQVYGGSNYQFQTGNDRGCGADTSPSRIQYYGQGSGISSDNETAYNQCLTICQNTDGCSVSMFVRSCLINDDTDF